MLLRTGDDSLDDDFQDWCDDLGGEYASLGASNGGACVLEGDVSNYSPDTGSRFVSYLENDGAILMREREKVGRFDTQTKTGFRASAVELDGRTVSARGSFSV